MKIANIILSDLKGGEEALGRVFNALAVAREALQVRDEVEIVFNRAVTQVLTVYPGPSDDLKAHASEFLQDKSWPADFRLLLDPDYSFTKTYGLRWDAPKETAYPSTFIIGKDSKVTFARVTRQHGDRVSADTVLKALNAGMMSDRAMKGGM